MALKVSFTRRIFASAQVFIGLFFTVFGLCFGGVGLLLSYDDWHINADGVITSGVIEKRWERHGDDGNTFYLAYRFRTENGETVYGSSSVQVEEWLQKREGDEVRIVYARPTPEKSRLESSSMWLLGTAFAVFGATCLAVGLLTLLRGIRKVQKRLRLAQEGTVAYATITGVVAAPVTINGVQQQCVTYTFKDTRGKTWSGTSEYFSPEEVAAQASATTAEVRYNPLNPEENVWVGIK